MEYLKQLKKITENEFATVVDDGTFGDVTGFISTGSYVLNAMCGASIFNGIPSNKIVVFAGEEATGKTYFVLDICRSFLQNNEKGAVIYFESENAISKEMMRQRDIDTKRVLMLPVGTVQEFRTQILKIIDNYLKTAENERIPMIIVLDSLGMLSTTKELEDSTEGKETADMTRARLIRSLFRTITLKLGQANLPLIITNHTYEETGLYATKKMSGGGGLKFANSATIFLSKRKEKSGTEVTGNIITCVLRKGRLTKEYSSCEVLLDYASGINPYHGLLDLGVKYGLFSKIGNKYDLGNGEKHFESHILKHGERYFTEELLNKLDDCARKEFTYGINEASADNDIEE